MPKKAVKSIRSLVPTALAEHLPGSPTGYGVHRVMGLETEFGIHAPEQPDASHVAMSFELINSYGAKLAAENIPVAATEWDYGEESPLRDARGWRIARSEAHPTQLTDQALVDAEGEPIHLLVNLLLPNGARFYVDHAHPEYSSPEVTNPLDAVIWDQAGDRIAQQAAEFLHQHSGTPEILLYKNNTDSKSVSYGAHENYLVARNVDFDSMATTLIPFFVSRQIVTGAGRVGIGSLNQRAGFQVSQRADFFEAEVGLETTVNRPIVNTRDEPHADAKKFRRLHVIIGDANLSQFSTWLRVGTTALVLALIETGYAPKLRLSDPVGALQAISHDPSATTTVEVIGRGRMTAVDLQEVYLSAAEDYCEKFGIQDQATTEVLNAWRDTLDTLRTDIFRLADRLDWVAKYQLMTGLKERHGLAWSDPKLGMLDLQYADLRTDKGLYNALVRRGSIRTLVDEQLIQDAISRPPRNTRAWARGRIIDLYGDHVVGASWESLALRPWGADELHRYLFPDPLDATAEDFGELLAPHAPRTGAERSPENIQKLASLIDQLHGYRTMKH